MKGIAGFYFVKSGETVYRCKARGLFKQQGMKPAVGDRVSFEPPGGEEDDGVITAILPRKNCFVRPFVSNVDCFVIVASAVRPEPSTQVIDKLLAMAEMADTEAVLCITKCDLARKENRTGLRGRENLEKLKRIYEPVYPIVCTEKDGEEDLEVLREHLRGKISALAGPSGVGKSSLLNRLLRQKRMETGGISEKSQRGRHTTRHAELFDLDEEGSLLFDTPGFTSFDLPEAEPEDLAALFPEMAEAGGECRFDNCRHLAEPGCRVKAAVEEGRIPKERYESYCAMYREAEERRKR